MIADKDVLRQQEAVRRSGKANMFNQSKVQVIAHESDFHQLVTFIEDCNPKEYVEMAEKSAEWYRGEGHIPEEDEVPSVITREVKI